MVATTARLEQAFRLVLSRAPQSRELERLQDALKTAPSEQEGFEDVATILFNLHETLHR